MRSECILRKDRNGSLNSYALVGRGWEMNDLHLVISLSGLLADLVTKRDALTRC